MLHAKRKASMKRSVLMAWLAAGLMAPGVLWAQEGDKDPAKEEAPKDAAKEGDPKAEPKGDPKDDPKADPKKPADGTTPPADGTTPPADGTTPPADPAKSDAVPPPADGKAVGPGGREMRTDYPGTPESLRESMDTAKIAGVGAKEEEKVSDLRVRELETRIDDLKDKVFRSKSRIVLLKETLLGGKLAGSRAVIMHMNKLGGGYEPVRLTYLLDSTPLYNELNANNKLKGKDEIELFNGSIGPGSHTLNVEVQYKGANAIFGYYSGYEFTIPLTCRFTVEEGRATIIDVEIYEGGNITTSPEDKPRARCKTTKTDISLDDIKKPEAKKK